MKTMLPPLLWVLHWSFLLAGSIRVSGSAAPPRDLILTESEWTGPNIIRVPFTLTGTLITVRARIDTLEGNFFFDTGAGSLLLNARHFSRQGLTASAGGGVTGRVRLLGSSRVDTFRLDNLTVTEVDAAMADLSHLENAKKIDLVGLIGYNVFKDYEVLLDYASSLLILVRIDPKGNRMEDIPAWEYQSLGSFPVTMAGHVAVLRLKFGKTGRYFAVDSGAEQNLLSNASGGRFLKENFEIERRVKLRGVGNAGIEVLSGTLSNARLDTLLLKPMATLITNLGEINAVYQTEVDGVLGYEFLSQRPVSINHRKRRLTFYTPGRP